MNGTVKNISTPEDLTNILGEDILNDDTRGRRYVITRTLDCSKLKNFIPLGIGSKYSFDGQLDGKGYVIRNLTISSERAYDLALFTKISIDGSVTNLRLENISIHQSANPGKEASTMTRAGAIAAVCQGEICGCSASGSITLQTKTDTCLAGGLCGSLPFQSSRISSSWADVWIGFQGDCVKKCGKQTSKRCVVGGVAGSSNGKIIACHSRSEIQSPGIEITDFSAGGICGNADEYSTVLSCYNIGYLHGRAFAGDRIGGIAGDAQTRATFSKCFYLKTCLLSKGFEKNGMAAHEAAYEAAYAIGTAKNWEELVKPGFAASELGADYTDTPADDYTYTPSLTAFPAPAGGTCDKEYLKALCTPVAVSFTQAVYPGTANPVKIDCTLLNCTLNKVTVTAVKKDHSRDHFTPSVSGRSFACDLGNNLYIFCVFHLFLKDRFGRSITVADADMQMNPNDRIILPHIEDPVVKEDGNSKCPAGSDAFDFVAGFVPAAKAVTDYFYEDYRYHWVGNGPYPYYSFIHFSAMVSGALYMTVETPDGETVVKAEIPFTEDSQKTPVLKVDIDTVHGDRTSFIFTVENSVGMKAVILWQKAKTVIEEKQSDSVKDGEKWQYPLKRLTWCMTNRCNLSCRHCAPRDMFENMTELSCSETRRVVKDLIKLGVSEVNLSGGEVFMNPYWYETAKALSCAGVKVGLITNGTLIDSHTAAMIKKSGIPQISVSIDDLEMQEGILRGESSFQKAVLGTQKLKAAGVPFSIITTVHPQNMDLLDEMRRVFTELGAEAWCLKPMLPIGEAARHQELWIDGKDICRMIEYCYSAINTTGLPVVPHLPFEMHTKKGAAVLRFLYGRDAHTDFYGCDAGIFSAQLNPDGGVVTICVSSPSDAAGNVKERSLADIWQDRSSFKELREFDPNLLEGYCGKCDRRDTCKGGDMNVRLVFGGIYAENKFCAYRNFKLYGITV